MKSDDEKSTEIQKVDKTENII